MTPQVFRAALKDLRLTQVGAAEFLRVQPTTVNRWARGKRKVPGPVAAALECLRSRRALEAQIRKPQMLSSSTTMTVVRADILNNDIYSRRNDRITRSQHHGMT